MRCKVYIVSNKYMSYNIQNKSFMLSYYIITAGTWQGCLRETEGLLQAASGVTFNWQSEVLDSKFI